MLIEPQPVVAELVDQFPCVEVLGIGSDCNLWFKMAAGEGVRKLGTRFQVVELLAIGKQVEDKDFHGTVPVTLGAVWDVEMAEVNLAPTGSLLKTYPLPDPDFSKITEVLDPHVVIGKPRDDFQLAAHGLDEPP